jgi:hypothetical protein
MRITRRLLFACLPAIVLLAGSSVLAQAPKVNQVSGTAIVKSGKAATASLTFNIEHDAHINSNKPLDEVLVPTTLKLQPPTQLVVARIQYPDGELLEFPFSPEEKLSLYTGNFTITAMVRAMPHTRPGVYRVHGELKYQACNNRQCFPPKTLPVALDVKVTR